MTRQRLYVDTMGFDPAAIRFSLDLLGVEHVVLWSDWPIMPIMPWQRVEEVLASLNLTEAQKAAILGSNMRLLLAQRPSPAIQSSGGRKGVDTQG